MMRNYIFRNGLLLVALLTIFLFSPATASWTALNLVTETPEQGQKLQHCQGHCRDDEDCEVGLKCVLRSNDDFEELLEQIQCTGTLEYEVNYCVDTWWSHRPTADEKSFEEHTSTGDDFSNQKQNTPGDSTSNEDLAPTGGDVSNQEQNAPADSTSKEEDGADDSKKITLFTI